MNKHQKFLISIIPLIIFILISLICIFQSPMIPINIISKNLQIIDQNIDHNQALEVLEYAKKNNVKIPSTIINFDTHSDVFLFQEIDKERGAQIANWLNEAFAKYPNIKQLYWVMPDEEAINPELQAMFIQKESIEDIMLYGNSQKNSNEVNPNVHKIPYVQNFLVDTKTGYIKEITNEKDKNKVLPLDPKFPKYKEIKIITCTKSTLPNFKNKNVILSIDGDYISNSGFDTQLNFTNNRTKKEISKETQKIIKTLVEKEIRPSIISLTLSPVYVPDEDTNDVMKFFKTFIKYSGKKDALDSYTRYDWYKQQFLQGLYYSN